MTDEEACSFLVALSRTRKSCHLVSCRRLGQEARNQSRFVDWLADYVQEADVNAAYFK